MPERYSDDRTTQRRETEHPDNPPNSVVEPELRKTPAFVVPGLWYYLGPFALFVLIVGFVLFMRPGERTPDTAVGTVGETAQERGDIGDLPDRQPGDIRDELRYRGTGSPPQGPMPPLVAGAAVDERGVEVVATDRAGVFWIERGGERTAVIPPAGAPAVRTGMRLDLKGVVEAAGQGRTRIRASQIEIRD
jgi:hypothetical protein